MRKRQKTAMMDNMDKSVSLLISEFPTEICRAVCVWWKQTVDGMLQRDAAWLKFCTRDFSKIYKDARLKSAPDLSWRELYKSLHIWNKLIHAEETWFEVTQRDEANITTMHAWKGTVATHTNQAVAYYNLETSECINTLNIGKFKMFEENDNVMVYMLYTDFRMLWFRNLKIVPKLKGLPSYENMVEIENVNNFVLVNQNIYYNKWYRNGEEKFLDICICNINDGLKCSLIDRNYAVWAFSNSEKPLNFITTDEKIYTLFDNSEFVLSDQVTNEDYFYKLYKYNLVEQVSFDNWIMDTGSITNRRRYLVDLTVRLWGDLALVGNEKGELKIYDRHLLFKEKGPVRKFDKSSSRLDIQKKPIKNYDLKIIFQLTNTKINGIDLVPIKDGHIVLVSTPLKIMALSLQIKSR